MMHTNLLAWFWEGFIPEYHVQLDAQSLLIRLRPEAERAVRCSGCGACTHTIHDTRLRRVRERDLFQYRVWLEVPVRRVRCPSCGPRTETISWLSGRQAMTRSMVNWVESLVRFMPVSMLPSCWSCTGTLSKPSTTPACNGK